MEGCGVDQLDPPSRRQLFEQSGRKLGAAVCSDSGRDAVGLDPSKGKSVDDRLSGNVHQWYGYRPSSKSVYNREKVTITI